MAYQVKALATKAHNLSSISGTPMGGGENGLPGGPLTSYCGTQLFTPSSLQNPQSENEYVESLSSQQLNEDVRKTSQFFED